MRARQLVAIALVLIPVAAEAQRIPMPRIRDRGPARPAPLPPTAPTVNREMRYVRLPYTVESYPLVSYVNAPGLGANLDHFVTGGMGERLDLRLTRQLSLTLDITQTFLGGPALTQSAELGARMRPEMKDARKWYPFFDVRGGMVAVAERNTRPYDYVDPTFSASYGGSSYGWVGVAGTGVEYALHPRFTLTTAGSFMRGSLAPLYGNTRNLDRVTMNATRYSIGLRYNPGRWSLPANLP